jgi:hypothetical protein
LKFKISHLALFGSSFAFATLAVQSVSKGYAATALFVATSPAAARTARTAASHVPVFHVRVLVRFLLKTLTKQR